MNKVILIGALIVSSIVSAQDQTINLNHNYTNNSWGQLDEEGVFELKDGTIAVVETSLNGLKGRKALRKKALKQLKMWQQWNDVEVKQINEKFRGASPGVGPKLTMVFKRVN